MSKEYTDSPNGLKVFEAIEGQTGTAVKLFYYLNEVATKEFSKDGDAMQVYELDIYDYMNRIVISVLLTDIR